MNLLATVKGLVFTEENQLAKSYAAVMALAVSADKEYSANEFQGACKFIDQDPLLRAHDITASTLSYFGSYTDSIKKVMVGGNIKFYPKQSELIIIAREVPKKYAHHLNELIESLMCITERDTEREVLGRINL